MSELALAAFASETGTHLVRPPHGERWRAFERRFDERAYLETLAVDGYRFLPRSSPEFPPLLRGIHDPPAGLFLRGVAKPEALAQPAVAIVGARACSGYGASVARSLGRDLASAGLVVVSGLARGVDAEAHRGALEAKGATLAVLGCGIDRDYPAAHAELARRVADAGLIVSEYAPGAEPAPWRFPARKGESRTAKPNPHGYATVPVVQAADSHAGVVPVWSGVTTPPRTWSRTVDCRAGRRKALRDAIAELPSGPLWDLVIRHSDGCDTLADWSDGELCFCTCDQVTLEAKELSVNT